MLIEGRVKNTNKMTKPYGRPFRAGEDFLKEIKKLQARLHNSIGKNPSLTDLSDEIAKQNLFTELEKRILTKKDANTLNFTIKFDNR